MEKVRGKFTCTKATDTIYGREVSLWAVYSNVLEDNSYSAATPVGNVNMVVSNPHAVDLFVEGQAYYLDFIPVNGTDSKT